MFLTTPADRQPIKSAIAGGGCDVWSRITLTLDFPWFCLSYSSRASASCGIHGTEFFCKPAQVAEFLRNAESDFQIDQLLLVSPPRLNRTIHWQMEPLSEVWVGHRKSRTFDIHAYVLQDGRRYIDAPDPADFQALQEVTQLVRYSPPPVN